MAKLAVIGGTGARALVPQDHLVRTTVDTPYGPPSGPLLHWREADDDWGRDVPFVVVAEGTVRAQNAFASRGLDTPRLCLRPTTCNSAPTQASTIGSQLIWRAEKLVSEPRPRFRTA